MRTIQTIPTHTFDSYSDSYITLSKRKINALLATSNISYQPGNFIFEKKIAGVLNATDAVVLKSDHNPAYYALKSILGINDNFISTNYFEKKERLKYRNFFLRKGISFKIPKTFTALEYEKLIDKNTKALFIESINLPSLEIADFNSFRELANKYSLPLILEHSNSHVSDIINPISFGADVVVVETENEFENGIGGIVYDAGTYNWDNYKIRNTYSKNSVVDSIWEKYKNYSLYGNVAFTARLIDSLPENVRQVNPFLVHSFIIRQDKAYLEIKK